MFINVKMPTIVGILIFMSMLNFMLRRVEYEQFYNLWAWPNYIKLIEIVFMFLFCLVLAMFCARLFICALWSPAGKGLTSWLSFVVSSVSLSLSHWYPGSGVVLDCIDS